MPKRLTEDTVTYSLNISNFEVPEVLFHLRLFFNCVLIPVDIWIDM